MEAIGLYAGWVGGVGVSFIGWPGGNWPAGGGCAGGPTSFIGWPGGNCDEGWGGAASFIGWPGGNVLCAIGGGLPVGGESTVKSDTRVFDVTLSIDMGTGRRRRATLRRHTLEINVRGSVWVHPPKPAAGGATLGGAKPEGGVPAGGLPGGGPDDHPLEAARREEK